MISPEKRRQNLRTAAIVGTIALAFFIGVIVRRYLYG